MTTEAFLRQGYTTLARAGVSTARLDTLVLLEDTLGMGRASILAHPETPIPSSRLAVLHAQLKERSQHIPLAYIRGKAPFYGRDFLVTADVLVPRPETEESITLLTNLKLPEISRIADIGTGSGCIAITVALEFKQSKVDAYDISPAAIAVAKKNNATWGTQVHFAVSDLLHNNAQPYDVLIANLPYVPDNYPINKAATFEPKQALFAGKDGLDVYRRLFIQLKQQPTPPLFVVVEALPLQHPALAGIATAHGYRVRHISGYILLLETTNLSGRHRA